MSYGANANHNQGVNISTGPNGEVYAVWSVYYIGSMDEDAIGFAKSLDGGETWETSYRIIDNIRGIRATGVPQNQRVNSFPAMAADISSGSNSGNIYVVWANVGVPGTNTGSDIDSYMIKSSDEGETWSDPIRINQDESGQGKTHYFPWIACDPSNGTVSVVFYDNRNTNNNQAEAWVAVTSDAGDSWEDFRVSDVSFTPTPIPGMASGYFGDYLGIAALDGKVYPCWTDNRSGHAMTYVSVFETIDITSPFNLQTTIDQETGDVTLNWNFNAGSGFQNFRVYRNDVLIEETTELTYSETLADYGYYNYKVTAFFGGSNESEGPDKDIQFGSPTMVVSPSEYLANVYPDDIELQFMTIKNNGVLDLDFSLSPFSPEAKVPAIAPTNGGGDEYISKLEIGDYSNRSADDGYNSYLYQPIVLEREKTYEIKVHVSNAYTEDVCYVWIDSNGNGEFDEPYLKLQSNDDNSMFYGLLTFEKGSAIGLTNMRIRLSSNENMNAYDDTKYGETEDYLLAIASWLGLNPDEGIIAPGDSLIVELAFDATGMEVGTYTDLIKFVTNDLDNPSYNIPVTMNVTNLEVEITADPLVICVGESTTLLATPTGGSGTYSYLWTSVPEGFSSNEQNPIVQPTENTKYIVAVNDGMITITASVDIVVFDIPVVNLIDLVDCEGSSILLDAENPGASYLWSTDETTQTIIVSGEGINQYWVVVTNENNCSAADTAIITFFENPQVDLGPDTIICQNQSVILDAGYPGSSYSWSTGQTTQTIVVDTSNFGIGEHSFSVSVITPLSCQGYDEIEVELLDCTGINESKATVSLVAYPNPSQGIINLKLESVENETIDIKIIGINGNTVYFEKGVFVNRSFKKQIDISNSANGIYTLLIIGDNYIIDEKIVLQQ